MRYLPERELLVTELLTAVVAAATGAAVMYFLDPNTGRRRRALVRDRAVALSHDAGHLALSQGRRAADHLKGAVASGRALVSRSSDPASDEQLHERIRSRLGRVVSHPGAVEVEVDQGRVCLRGHVLADEVDALLSEVRSQRGVERVDNELWIHEEAGAIPELQGSGRDEAQGGSYRMWLALLAVAAPLALWMASQSTAYRPRRTLQRIWS